MMKILKKLLLSIVITTSTLIVTVVTIPEIENVYIVEAASVKISKTKYTMNVGEKYTLKVKGTKKKVKWSTSNKKVATINSKGKVTAKKKGTVTITAKVSGRKYKCKIKVEKPTINTKSKTMYLGNTYNLKISKTTQKVKWSTSNKKIATVDTNGIVTAKKVGTTTITAKVGNTKYKCKIKVKDYENNIKISYLKTDTSVIAILTNNNSTAVSIKPDMIFYNAKGNIQSKTTEFNYCFAPKSTIALEFRSYNTSTYEYQTYSSYKLSLGKVEKSYYSPYTSKIKVNASKTDGCIIAEVKNNSGKKLNFINIAIVYYDMNNKVIGYDETYADCTSNGSTDYISLDYPYDENYEDIVPANYKVYVNYAY